MSFNLEIFAKMLNHIIYVNIYILQSYAKYPECSLIIGTGCLFNFVAWFMIAQSVYERTFGLLGSGFMRCQVRTLSSSEEDKFVSFRFEITSLCQSIFKNNKYVYRHTQGWSNFGSGIKCIEYSLIISTGCWLEDFAWSSIVLSVCERAFCLLEREPLSISRWYRLWTFIQYHSYAYQLWSILWQTTSYCKSKASTHWCYDVYLA